MGIGGYDRDLEKFIRIAFVFAGIGVGTVGIGFFYLIIRLLRW